MSGETVGNVADTELVGCQEVVSGLESAGRDGREFDRYGNGCLSGRDARLESAG